MFNKKLFSLVIAILVFLLLAIMVSTPVQGNEIDAEKPEYDGDEQAYIITTLEELVWVGRESDPWDDFLLEDNIEAGETADSENEWEPIGDPENPYLGTFDGQGNEIRSLSISRGKKKTGVFGVIGEQGYVKDLEIKDLDSIGSSQTGGLAGVVKGDVEEVSVSGDVWGTDSVGGVIGLLEGGEVEKVRSDVNVFSLEDEFVGVGGLVGRVESGDITYSYSLGEVEGDEKVGGLVGVNEPDGEIMESFSSSEVQGEVNVGGLVGFNDGVVQDSVWDTEASNIDYSDGGVGYSTEEMENIETFLDLEWDIENVERREDKYGDHDYIWNIVDGETYPFLSWEIEKIPIYHIKIEVNEGEGATYPSPATYSYERGDEVEIVAQPAYGWRFKEWTGDISSEEDNLRFEISESKSLEANFERDYFDLEINIKGDGVENNFGEGTHSFEYENEVSLKAQSKFGWKFERWESGENYGNEEIEVEILEDKKFTAIFEREYFDLLVEMEEGSSIIVEDEKISGSENLSFKYNEYLDIEVDPDHGWVFQNWEEPFYSPENVITVNLNENGMKVQPVFEREEFEVQVGKHGDGEIQPEEGTYTYEYEEEIELEAVPSEDWRFVEWKINDELLSEESEIVFEVEDDVELEAVFDEKISTWVWILIAIFVIFGLFLIILFRTSYLDGLKRLVISDDGIPRILNFFQD